MQNILDSYKQLLGNAPVDDLIKQATLLRGKKIVHINSTKEGGGVAEILTKMIPIMEALGLKVEWKVIEGTPDFFTCSKMFHNLLQGEGNSLPSSSLLSTYEKINAKNAEALKDVLQEADIVFVHDPQPLALISSFPKRRGKWIWRCHIDLSAPFAPLWNYLKPFVEQYDASIFSLKDYKQALSHPIYEIAPSIDPLSDKNIELSQEEIAGVFKELNIDMQRPSILQVSRFDRFKDPIGVIKAYRIAKNDFPDLQLILAGSGASDDPEGEAVLKEVQDYAKGDSDIHILLLPASAHKTINALQRGSDIVLQKSLKEGFGLTVSEALWKKKAVIGGDVGGIRLQIIDHETGFLVSSPKQASDRIGTLLHDQILARNMGEKGSKHVRENFLITRHLKDYLHVMLTHLNL